MDGEEKQGLFGGVPTKEKISLMCQGKVAIMKNQVLLFICARNVWFSFSTEKYTLRKEP